ncbi:MAG: hypothetical protein PHQ60_13235 [Sideroxydans sp.]|nr:hypothetical protein [Sideroxydans sp.]
MSSIRACPLPDVALLNTCLANGEYTDCFAADVAGSISHEQFVAAFYTTFVFKLERAILKWAVAKPSTDAQAKQLAAGAIDEFAAWHVEQRCPDQLLMSDFQSRTRSWLMVAPITVGNVAGTRLYFGSAVVPVTNRKTGEKELDPVFRALLGFHKIYSKVLLRAAVNRLNSISRSRVE